MNDAIKLKKFTFQVKQNLGFDRTRILGIGAAPMSKETFQYFLSLDIPLYECYGKYTAFNKF